MSTTDTHPLQRLAERGQSVWIDYLSRELLHGGSERLVKAFGWPNNERGYSCRLVDLVARLA